MKRSRLSGIGWVALINIVLTLALFRFTQTQQLPNEDEQFAASGRCIGTQGNRSSWSDADPAGDPSGRLIRTPLLRKPNQTDDTVNRALAFLTDSAVASVIASLEAFETRVYSHENRETVFTWVKNRFLHAGVSDVQFDNFEFDGTIQRNIVATMVGTVRPAVELIIGGHIDSYSRPHSVAPGADDNASGTAATILMAEALVQAGYQPNNTLLFIGFAAEEAGLIGSRHYANAARQARRNIALMMNFDMIGYRNPTSIDREFYIMAPPENEAYARIHSECALRYTSLQPIINSSTGGSDDRSFYDAGFRTLWNFETDFNPHYHTANDRLEYLDVSYARDITGAALATIITLDQYPPPVDGVRIRDRGDGRSILASWDSSHTPDYHSYRISIGQSPGNYTTTFLTKSLSYAVGGLSEGQRCYVGISVRDVLGQESLIVVGSGESYLVPRPPTGLTVAGEGLIARLAWQPNTELDLRGYYVYLRGDSDTMYSRSNQEPTRDPGWSDSTQVAGRRAYYVTAIDSTGHESVGSDTVWIDLPLGIATDLGEIPLSFQLFQNYPNPFNPSTVIRYAIPGEMHVTLAVYNVLGEELTRLVDDIQEAGSYEVRWLSDRAPSGVYFYRLRSGTFSETRKLVLTR